MVHNDQLYRYQLMDKEILLLAVRPFFARDKLQKGALFSTIDSTIVDGAEEIVLLVVRRVL